jgi:hypothetical protein
MLQLKSGAVLVEFYSGARVVIEGPAKLNLISASEARLDEGRVNAHVPPQARGFTLNTDGMKVIDHGTDFGLVAGAGAPSEVHVFSGDVEINPTGHAARHLVTGEAVAMTTGNMQTMNATRSAFLDEATLIDRSNERLQVWKAASAALDSDPAMLLHFTFDDATTRRDVRNHAARAEAESGGAIVGGAWTTGRWPGKGALGFSGESDRVRFTVAQPAHEMTLLAWVRVDSLAHSQNALLVSDSEQPGSLRWHLTRNGELRLEIARDLGRSYSDWEAVNSRSFVKPERWGQWMLLATTFDGKTIRHYANGELIGSGASFTPPSINIGTAELANWRGDVKRNLSAAFDEFAVLSRAMNEDELRRMFEAGKP